MKRSIIAIFLFTVESIFLIFGKYNTLFLNKQIILIKKEAPNGIAPFLSASKADVPTFIRQGYVYSVGELNPCNEIEGLMSYH